MSEWDNNLPVTCDYLKKVKHSRAHHVQVYLDYLKRKYPHVDLEVWRWLPDVRYHVSEDDFSELNSRQHLFLLSTEAKIS